MDPKAQPVLVTGATGYVGGRLVPKLLNAGYRVRALGRAVAKLRGRPWGAHPRVELAQGDVLDFWRVLAVAPPQRLLLLAEMQLPGEAVLEFTLAKASVGGMELRQIARFLPRGLGGLLYWYALIPLHHWVYRGMLRAVAREAGKPICLGPEQISGRKRQDGRQ